MHTYVCIYGFVRCVSLQTVSFIYVYIWKIKLNCPRSLTSLFIHHGYHRNLGASETTTKSTQNRFQLAAEIRGYLCFWANGSSSTTQRTVTLLFSSQTALMTQHEGPGRLLAGAVSPSYAFLPFGTEAAQAHRHEEGGLGIWSYGNSTITSQPPEWARTQVRYNKRNFI